MFRKRILLCMLLLFCIWCISRFLFTLSLKINDPVEIVNRLIDLSIIFLNLVNFFVIRYIFILFLKMENATAGELPVKSIVLCLISGFILNTIFCIFMLPFWMYAFIPVILSPFYFRIKTIKQGILFVIITFTVTLTGILSIPFFFWLITGCVTAFTYRNPRWIQRILCGVIAIVFVALSFAGLFLCHEIKKDDDQHLIFMPFYLGADPKFRFFSTPLSGLAKGYLVGPAQLLLRGGADPMFTDDMGRTALYEATRTGSINMMKLLIDYGARVNGNPNFHDFAPIMGAIWRNDVERIQFLVEHGVSLNIPTILHSALYSYKDPEILTILLELGAPVNGQDIVGNTPLHIAVSSPMSLIVLEILISHEADPNLVNMDGQTPLDYAIMAQNNPAKEYLQGLMGKRN